ncbi:hypothetical protein KW791_02960, partial [Candidatus Parcubacteria bacterium]|nr:hypothetical protein [Candidatus Parcubacteria bacterium]
MTSKINSPFIPLTLLGLFVIVQILGKSAPMAILVILGLAFVQSIAYSLQSRSAVRNSNLYHIGAAIFSSLVFFTTRQLLITKNLPFILLPAYVFGTVTGATYGKKISQKVEKLIDARTGPSDKNKSQLLQFWPSLMVLSIALAGEILFLSNQPMLLLGIAALAFFSSLGFSIVRVTRNSDNHWVHLGAILFEAVMAFLLLKIMIDNNMNWILFIPNLTGNMIASLSGSELAKKILAMTKSSTDGHVKEGKAIRTPYG